MNAILLSDEGVRHLRFYCEGLLREKVLQGQNLNEADEEILAALRIDRALVLAMLSPPTTTQTARSGWERVSRDLQNALREWDRP